MLVLHEAWMKPPVERRGWKGEAGRHHPTEEGQIWGLIEGHSSQGECLLRPRTPNRDRARGVGAQAVKTGGDGGPWERGRMRRGLWGFFRENPRRDRCWRNVRSPPPRLTQNGAHFPDAAGGRAAHPLAGPLLLTCCLGGRGLSVPRPICAFGHEEMGPTLRPRLRSSPSPPRGGSCVPCSSPWPRCPPWPRSRQDLRLRCRGQSRRGGDSKRAPPPPSPLHWAPPALRAPLPAAHPARCRRSAPPAPKRSGLGAGPSGEGRAGAEPPLRRPRGGPPPLFLFLPSSLSPVSRLLAPLLFCALPARAPARPAHR